MIGDYDWNGPWEIMCVSDHINPDNYHGIWIYTGRRRDSEGNVSRY